MRWGAFSQLGLEQLQTARNRAEMAPGRDGEGSCAVQHGAPSSVVAHCLTLEKLPNPAVPQCPHLSDTKVTQLTQPCSGLKCDHSARLLGPWCRSSVRTIMGGQAHFARGLSWESTSLVRGVRGHSFFASSLVALGSLVSLWASVSPSVKGGGLADVGAREPGIAVCGVGSRGASAANKALSTASTCGRSCSGVGPLGDPTGSLWGPGAAPGLPGAPNCSKAWNFSPHTARRLVECRLLTAPGRDP